MNIEDKANLNSEMISKIINLYTSEIIKKSKEISVLADEVENMKKAGLYKTDEYAKDKDYNYRRLELDLELPYPTYYEGEDYEDYEDYEDFEDYEDYELEVELGIDHLKEEMNDKDKVKLDMYYAAANFIKTHLTNKEVYVEIQQIKKDFSMEIKIQTDTGPVSLLSDLEKKLLDSGNMTLIELTTLVNSLK